MVNAKYCDNKYVLYAISVVGFMRVNKKSCLNPSIKMLGLDSFFQKESQINIK